MTHKTGVAALSNVAFESNRCRSESSEGFLVGGQQVVWTDLQPASQDRPAWRRGLQQPIRHLKRLRLRSGDQHRVSPKLL